MVAINTWLEPVVSEAATLLQLQEGLGSVDVDNNQMQIAARQAYSHVRGHCQRSFHQDTYVEFYPTVCERVRLRTDPIVSITAVYTGTYLDELVSTSDYRLMHNQLWLTGFTSTYITGLSDLTEVPLVIEYTGGYALSNTIESFANASK